MNKRFLATLVLASGMILALAAAGGAQAANPVTMKAGTTLPVDHPYALALDYIAKRVAERTNGQVVIQVFPGGQLGNESDMIEGCQLGTLDMCVTATAPLASFTKAFLVTDLPYLFRDKDHAHRVMDSEIGQEMLKSLENAGIVGLAIWEAGMTQVMNSKRPLVHPKDVRGLNIRVMENAIYMAFFTALGGNPVPMAWSEVFTSIQNGTVDGTTNPVATVYTSGVHTVAKYTSMLNNFYIPAPLIMGKSSYGKLNAEQQAILRDAASEATDYMRKIFVETETAQLADMIAKGCEVNEVNQQEWIDAVVNVVYPQFIPSQISQEQVDRIRNFK